MQEEKQCDKTIEIREIDDVQVLKIIWMVIQKMRERGDEESMECILNEEKLIHLIILISERQKIESFGYDISAEVVNFVQKINKIVMENFKEEGCDNSDLKLFSKAVDVLMNPNLHKYFTKLDILGKLKVLTFNNLACFYKKKKKYIMALKSVSFALNIEQFLAKDNQSQEKYDIIPTYLNKAAIYSEMGKHDKAIDQILKSKKHIQRIQKQVSIQMSNTTDSALKKRLQEKKHYGLYMKMLIHYNIGVEKEHLKFIQSAGEHYQQGRKLAVMINNNFMIKKFDAILKKIKIQ